MQRNNLIKYIMVLCVAAGLTSCDKDFEEINTNPNASTKPNVNYLFTQSLLRGNYVYDRNYFYTAYLNCGMFVQHFATYKDVAGAGVGDKYGANDFYQGFYYRYIYNNVINTLSEAIRAANTPDQINKLAAARIWRVLLMQRITDTYGDVPYKQAVLGYLDGIFSPAYDPQSEIYADLLKELDEAIRSFDASKPTFGNADLIYKGNIDQWKKFGYSLMLRVAMRLTKRDEPKAREWAQKAITGGVILLPADNAVIKYSNGPQIYNNNPVAYELVGQDYIPGAAGINNTEGGKFSKTFIDFLKNRNDPRLNVVAVTYNGTTPDTSTGPQQGLPNGLPPNRPPSFNLYSEPNPATILQYAAPLLVLTNAETNFLLSEAALRGWATGTTAAQYYKTGIENNMANWTLFGAGGVIAAGKVNAYTTANALNTAGSFDAQMNQVHTQLWVALLLDGQEAFANWRRTGYPQLAPVNYTGNATGGVIPRRFPYSQPEQGMNKANYNAAVARQGADLLTTRVWWDKQ